MIQWHIRDFFECFNKKRVDRRNKPVTYWSAHAQMKLHHRFVWIWFFKRYARHIRVLQATRIFSESDKNANIFFHHIPFRAIRKTGALFWCLCMDVEARRQGLCRRSAKSKVKSSFVSDCKSMNATKIWYVYFLYLFRFVSQMKGGMDKMSKLQCEPYKGLTRLLTVTEPSK